MTYIHSCSLYCERPECVKAQRDEMRDGIKRHEEMAAMASAEIADLTAELAQLRAVEPVAPPGWREALQFYADRSHFVIADADACDAIAARCRALADAPPTVAELLPMVDATHEVRWTLDDDERRATGDDAGTLAFQWRTVGGSLWSEAYPSVADLAQPARLVEVAP